MYYACTIQDGKINGVFISVSPAEVPMAAGHHAKTGVRVIAGAIAENELRHAKAQSSKAAKMSGI